MPTPGQNRRKKNLASATISGSGKEKIDKHGVVVFRGRTGTQEQYKTKGAQGRKQKWTRWAGITVGEFRCSSPY